MRVTLSLRGDYAVRAMLALGQHEHKADDAAAGPDSPLTAGRIATQMRIPPRFVAHVMADLARAGLVIGTTGRRGGYRLAVPAATISLLRITDAAEPNDAQARCVLRGIPCDDRGRCAVHEAFSSTTNAMRAELAGASLADFVGHRR